MVHVWIRAEERDNEARVGITPQGCEAMMAKGWRVSVERSDQRALAIEAYERAGCEIVPQGSWRTAPQDAIILGLKELPEDGTPLTHRHIMFGHAYKGQPSGRTLLDRFKAGGGTLYDLEYLVDDTGRRVAAFGYWAGYAGAAVALKCWAAQQRRDTVEPVYAYQSASALVTELEAELKSAAAHRPTALVIGALGRVGTGASDLCEAMGIRVTKWDMVETAAGGPFPEILDHDIFFNCILARPGTPVFIPVSAETAPRTMTVIADIACDPDSDYSPIKVYDRATSWQDPALRVHSDPVLDVTAIDNLPSLLPAESSDDFAQQLLPTLLALDAIDQGVWARANDVFIREV
jgi:saccharopine dehydrogenase (NAD+, L-lysine-forming)